MALWGACKNGVADWSPGVLCVCGVACIFKKAPRASHKTVLHSRPIKRRIVKCKSQWATRKNLNLSKSVGGYSFSFALVAYYKSHLKKRKVSLGLEIVNDVQESRVDNRIKMDTSFASSYCSSRLLFSLTSESGIQGLELTLQNAYFTKPNRRVFCRLWKVPA